MLRNRVTARSGKARAGRVAGTLVIGGTGTLGTTWAVGKLAQGELVTGPSRRFYEYCYQHRSAALVRRMESVTILGDYGLIGSFTFLVGGMIAYQRRDWRPVPLLAAGVVAEVYLQKALKHLVRGTLPPQETSVGPPGDYPSGGAARTVITFGLLAHLLAQDWASPAEKRVLRSIVAALVAAQGGSRLYLGRHWAEDVAGGWLFGWLILRTLTRAEGLTGGPAAAR